MKMVKQILVILLVLVSFGARSQESINKILSEIEENSPGITALRAQFENEKAQARTDLLPPNPIVEFGRFPAVQGAGVKQAWGVSQHFEFPTVYAKRNQLAKSTDRLANASYNATRQELLLEAKQTILELIGAKRMLSEYKKREAFAYGIQSVFQRMVDAGETSILELNNAKLRVAEISQSVLELESKVKYLNSKLLIMNGYKPISITDSAFVIPQLPAKDSLLNDLRQNDPRIAFAGSLVEVADMELVLTKHQGLPELGIGYESEKTDAEHFAGFRAGVSIPLWGNSGKRRAAKVNLNLAQMEEQKNKSMIELEFDENYIVAQSASERLAELKRAVSEFSNIDLLRRALEIGQISTVDFFYEITYLYEVTDKLMELELKYMLHFAALNKHKL